MKRTFKRITHDLILWGLMVAALYYEQGWARNILVFFIWLYASTMLIIWNKFEELEFPDGSEQKTWEKWYTPITSFAETAAFAAFGWWFTAIAYVVMCAGISRWREVQTEKR